MIQNSRRGFTLIELLVTMAIITTLATLAVFLAPSINGSRAASTGADRLQQTLLIAKQQAKRDQIATGIRLIPDPINANQVLEIVYIQQPDNYSPVGSSLFVQQAATVPPGNPAYPQPRVVRVTGDITPFVSEGDLLELTGVTNTASGIYRIAGPNNWPWNVPPYNAPAPTGAALTFANGVTTFQVTSEIREARDSNLVLAGNFRFIRQPRVLLGEEPVRLPEGVAIDLQPLSTKGNRPPLDILFAPSGQVYAGPTTPLTGRIVLHVKDLEGRGAATLITIYARTGQIAAHPINTDPTIDSGDPYGYTTDGKSSGL